MKAHYNEYIVNNGDNIIRKAQKRENESVDVSLRNYNIFIKRLKSYIGDTNENAELLGEEPGQFVFNLFLQKIGLNLS